MADERVPWRSPVERLVWPLVRFMQIESASGFVLLACTALALWLTNSSHHDDFVALWKMPVDLRIGDFVMEGTLGHWINDGLMVIFFFVVGLEIKRELVLGELRDPKKAALPAMAALGGMVVPAGLYLALQHGQPGEPGWGVPMATDIAFVVGFLALLGRRVPAGLKILLLSLAIVDDIGAVVVIAAFYTAKLNLAYLGYAAVGFALTYLFNLMGVRRVPVYVVIGIGIWFCFHESGVHPTVAGVLLGLLTPTSAWFGEKALVDVLLESLPVFRGEAAEVPPEERHKYAVRVARTAQEVVSPLERLEEGLHPWVAFVIMPLFALSNAGVVFQTEALSHPVAIAVAIGLVIGKPVGIVFFSWAAVKAGFARLPEGVNWKMLIGGGCLAGIGFTMALFIAGLAFRDLPSEYLDAGKIGTLLGSAISAVLGCSLLLLGMRRQALQQATGEPQPQLETG